MADRGFVFASLGPAGPTLAEHLGTATRLIDRSCDLSPVGEVRLTAGWVKHRCAANWKMLRENDSDGYHLGFVHRALFTSIRTQYQRVVGEERSASFQMPEDLIAAARNQQGLGARTAEWLLLARGLDRESVDAEGWVVSHVTDETTNRGLWRHYRTVMTAA